MTTWGVPLLVTVAVVLFLVYVLLSNR